MVKLKSITDAFRSQLRRAGRSRSAERRCLLLRPTITPLLVVLALISGLCGAIVTAGPAAAQVATTFIAQNEYADVSVGTPFAVQVEASDSPPTVLTSDNTDTVALSLEAYSGGGSLSCLPGLQETVTQGVANFECTISQAGLYFLEYTFGSLTGQSDELAVSSSHGTVLNPVPNDVLTFTSSIPGGGYLDETTTPTFDVDAELEDTAGALQTVDTNPVILSVVDWTASYAGGANEGTISCLPTTTSPTGTTQQLQNGLVSFQGCSISQPGDYFVELTDGPDDLIASFALTVLNASTLLPQAIAFTTAAAGTVGLSASLSATGGGSGNPVVFSVDPSSASGACNVSGTDGATVDYTGVGTCVIDANQPGNATYAPAPQVQQDITVGPGTVTVSVSGSEIYGFSPSLTLTPTATDLPPGVTLSGTLTCNTVNGGTSISSTLPAGTYTVDGTSCSGMTLSDSTDYSLSYVGAQNGLVVTPATITESVSGSEVYGEPSTLSLNLTYTLPDGSHSLPPGVTVSGNLICADVYSASATELPISATLPVGSYTVDGASCEAETVSDSTDYTLSEVGVQGGFVVSPVSALLQDVGSGSGSATTTDGELTATGSGGAGTVTVGEYSADPEGPPSFEAAGTTIKYFDVSISNASFTALTFTICGLTGSPDSLYWWDQSAGGWESVTPASAVSPAGPACPLGEEGLTVTLTNSTVPSLSQITGTVFAVAEGLKAQRIYFTSRTLSHGRSRKSTVGQSYVPTAVATSGLPVGFSIASGSAGACSLADGVVEFIGPGRCVIVASQPGDTEYAAARGVEQVIFVHRLHQMRNSFDGSYERD
ncbi:MAG TPA: hypothetical protein VEJ84_05160 [Acidimicrobiales bacterium]|nr:hypothetical protein [Acidimicrobiales bacterium]